jgi:hypothetical protein
MDISILMTAGNGHHDDQKDEIHRRYWPVFPLPLWLENEFQHLLGKSSPTHRDQFGHGQLGEENIFRLS